MAGVAAVVGIYLFDSKINSGREFEIVQRLLQLPVIEDPRN